MRRVVSWVEKSNGLSLAKGSPRIITASACALIITYHMEKKALLNNQDILTCRTEMFHDVRDGQPFFTLCIMGITQSNCQEGC